MFRTEIIVVVCLIELVFLIKDILENHQDQRVMKIGKCVGLVIALVIELVPNLVQNKNIYWIIAPAVELVPNLDQDKIIYWILKAIVFLAMLIAFIILLCRARRKIPSSDGKKEALRADRYFKIFSGFLGVQIYFSRFQFMIGMLTCIRIILLIFVHGRITLDLYNSLMIIYVVIESIVAFAYGCVWPYLKKWQKLRYMKHIKDVT